MTPIEPEKYERDWKAMRKRSMGELLEMKLSSNTRPYWLALTEMELERRTFVRDRVIDRVLSIAAIIISASVMTVAILRYLKEPTQQELAGRLSTPAPNTTALNNLPAKTPLSRAANTATTATGVGDAAANLPAMDLPPASPTPN